MRSLPPHDKEFAMQENMPALANEGAEGGVQRPVEQVSHLCNLCV